MRKGRTSPSLDTSQAPVPGAPSYRRIQDPVRRSIPFQEADHHHEGVRPGHELARAVQRVDEEDSVRGAIVLPLALRALFGHDRDVRIERAQALANELVRASGG